MASGPSITQADVDYCRGKGKIYTINETHQLAPWADVCYAADDDWWQFYRGLPEFAGERWTCSREAAARWALHHVEVDLGLVWSHRRGVVAYGGNSGFQALNLAVLQGAERVILLGYDMGLIERRKHWFTGQDPRPPRASAYADWLTRFDAAAGEIPVPVLNASPSSAIRCFEKVDLRSII